MNLRVFQSIKQQTSSLKAKLPPCFHGIAVPAYPDGDQIKWVCELQTHNVKEATNMLEALSRLPTGKLPEFVVFHNHPSMHSYASTDDTLSYLRDILPIGAQFCEDHPTIGGSNYKRLNAHGKPLNDNVVGICHSFPHHSIAELAIILDVFLPTRLALSPDTVIKTLETNKDYLSDGEYEDDDDWEAVVQNTDMLILGGGDNSSPGFNTLVQHVWKAQEQDGVQNSFAICDKEKCADELHMLFDSL